MLDCVEKLDYLCNCKSEIGNVCNAVQGLCLQAMNNPSREAISMLSGKCKRFTFVHPVYVSINTQMLK